MEISLLKIKNCGVLFRRRKAFYEHDKTLKRIFRALPPYAVSRAA